MDYEGAEYHAELATSPSSKSSIGFEDDPLLSPNSEQGDRRSVNFAKAALTFHDRLRSIRRKRDTLPLTPPISPDNATTSKYSQIATVAQKPGLTVSPPETPITPSGDAQESPAEDASDSPPPKRIRVLRAIQSLLTALVSLSIAIFQGKVYVMYLQTRNIPGAWPTTPNLMPTLLLFIVAVASVVFDTCLIVAYTAHNKRYVSKAVRIASSAHYATATAKGVTFALTAAVCKSGFNFGNASGNNNDLWSWTCSANAAKMDHVTQASSNCSTQMVAWVFAIVQAGIELFGMAIDWYTKQKAEAKQGKAKALSQEDQEKQLNAMGDEMGTDLSGLTPPLPSQ